MTSDIQALVAVSAFVQLSNVLLATFEPTSSSPLFATAATTTDHVLISASGTATPSHAPILLQSDGTAR